MVVHSACLHVGLQGTALSWRMASAHATPSRHAKHLAALLLLPPAALLLLPPPSQPPAAVVQQRVTGSCTVCTQQSTELSPSPSAAAYVSAAASGTDAAAGTWQWHSSLVFDCILLLPLSLQLPV